jgi:hypothetical protein
VHPVMVDTGKADKNGNRYWVLALSQEESSAPYKRALWAQGLDAAGATKTNTTWLNNSTFTTPGPLSGVTQVCGMDAAYNPTTGAIAVALVIRKGDKDVVSVVRKNADGSLGSYSVVSAKSELKGDCRKGYAGVRLAAAGADWVVAMFRTTSSKTPTEGKLILGRLKTTGIGPLTTLASAMTTDSVDGFAASPKTSLAWRGLSGLVHRPDGAVTVVVEGLDGKGNSALTVETVWVK